MAGDVFKCITYVLKKKKYNFKQNNRKIYRRVLLTHQMSGFKESNYRALFAIKITKWTNCTSKFV